MFLNFVHLKKMYVPIRYCTLKLLHHEKTQNKLIFIAKNCNGEQFIKFPRNFEALIM